MTEEEANNYEKVFKKMEALGDAYLNQVLFLFSNITMYEPKSREFGILLTALSHGKDSVHDLYLYIKILREKIIELRMAHDN